jgi:hypothetical protein
MWASGHHEVVRTLLQAGADVNAQSNVRNPMIMIMMMMIIIMLTMMMMMMIMNVVLMIEDGGDCRYR